ncbi:metallophosphoesterase family protein [Salipiger sp.]|uniref:metallophosphoesterase family protein n=1 Tax=Salipiger sp. TaxID=2078585 RepID=UPI003A96B024
MKLLPRLFSRRPAFSAALAPDQAFYAVGDVHGCDAQLERMLDTLAAGGHPTAALVMVGDYIDRGDESAAVLSRLFEIQQAAPQGQMICLKGNHEAMLLAFLDDPARNGPRWMRHGGLQTLASYRIAPPMRPDPADAWHAARDQLRAALGEDLELWLKALPTRWQSGNVLVAHAGAQPTLPVEAQPEDALLWGHPDFLTRCRTDGLWVVYGHYITDNPEPADGRIPVDTGAYATGRLTAALVEPGKASYIHSE